MRSGNRAVTGTTRVGPSGSATGFGSAGSSGNGAGSPGRFGGGAIFRTPDERFFVGLVVWPSRLREAGGKPAPWFALAYSFGFAACFGDGFFGAVNLAESAACGPLVCRRPSLCRHLLDGVRLARFLGLRGPGLSRLPRRRYPV